MKFKKISPEMGFSSLCFLSNSELEEMKRILFSNSIKAAEKWGDIEGGIDYWITAVRDDINAIIEIITEFMPIPYRILEHSNSIRKNLILNYRILQFKSYKLLEIHNKEREYWVFKRGDDSKILTDIESLISFIEINISNRILPAKYLETYKMNWTVLFKLKDIGLSYIVKSGILSIENLEYLIKKTYFDPDGYLKIENLTFGRRKFKEGNAEIITTSKK